MRNAAYILGPIAFLIAVLAIFVTLLPACALVTSQFGYLPQFCAKPEPQAASLELEREIERGKLLEAEVRRLERELLAKANCPVAPEPVPEPEPEPEPEDRVEEIDRDKWEQRDLSVLEGCWVLDSDYRAQIVGTNQEITIEEWVACFDAEGNGTGQEFRSSHGPVCRGPQRAEFNDQNELIIRDLRDVPCTQNFRFLKRTIECELSEENLAECIATDEGGGASSLSLRRQQ